MEREICANLALGKEIIPPPFLAAAISLILDFSANLLSGIRVVTLLAGEGFGDSALRFFGAGMTSSSSSSSFSSASPEVGVGFRM